MTLDGPEGVGHSAAGLIVKAEVDGVGKDDLVG